METSFNFEKTTDKKHKMAPKEFQVSGSPEILNVPEMTLFTASTQSRLCTYISSAAAGKILK